MNDDCLKLTSYFGERSRTEHQFVADALLDIYGRSEVATSVMLRGIAGFGLKHHLRTDLSLTLSEDLPLTAIAVDTRPKIEDLIDDVTRIKDSGVVTLERARLLQDEIGPVTLPEELHEATKLTVYLGRQQRVYGMPAFQAICDLFHRKGLDGATVLLGVDGTAHGRRERARFFDRNADVPLMVIAVGSGERISQVLPELGGLLRRPLITLERVRVCKRDGTLYERPHALPEVDDHGRNLWQKLMVYTSESTLHERQPIHRALVERLRRSNVARGATSVRGVWGFHGDHRPHGDRFFQLHRRVPVTTTIVDTPEHIAACFDIVDEVTRERGLVTTEMVPALASIDHNGRSGGLGLANHSF